VQGENREKGIAGATCLTWGEDEFMKSYPFGKVRNTGNPFRLPRASFDTHWHLIGGTGKGKTTAIHTILHQILRDPTDEACVFIIDRMGNLSFELLLWMASEFCTEDVRDRLVYIEPAREDVVMGFNPFLHESQGHAFYKASRASEIILKGWSNQNLEEMPRLARWLFNSFIACTFLGLNISDTVHLLLPGSSYHLPLLNALPERLKVEWKELIESRSSEVGRMLESARNRLKPYYEAPVLRQMFGSTVNRLDVLRFMREKRVVVLNLAPGNRLPDQIADAIGGLVLNEILTTARSLPFGVRYPTFLFLDEFQRFVGPDIESAIPEVRQLGIKLLLSHQSLSQLKRGDHDLTTMIFQCQSRMIFGVQGEDADLLAHELASLEFNPKRIKDEHFSLKQRLVGHRLTELKSGSSSRSAGENWMRNFGKNWGTHANLTAGLIRGTGTNSGETEGNSGGGSLSESVGAGWHEQLVPVHNEYLELASRQYYSFDEMRSIWARDIRNLRRGTAFLRLVDDPTLYHVDVKRSAPGHLSWTAAQLREEMPEALDDVYRLIERNFQSDLFVSPAVIAQETQERLDRVIRATSESATADAANLASANEAASHFSE
jgi:TraM recognition site of TraD and TraG